MSAQMQTAEGGTAAASPPEPNDTTASSDKLWMKPCGPKELRQHAANWSLAADAGLLKYLQEFSTNFVAKAHESTLGMNNLIHDTSMTDARMRNVTDRFLTLSDSQFIENRVYDEDVSKDSHGDAKENPEEKKEERGEIDPFPKLKEAIQSGMRVLEDAFDILDANAANSDYDSESNSDDEADKGNDGIPVHIYEPKDPYIMRPLPYLIGSRGFIESDDVGIKDLPSDDEDVQDDHGSISESDEDIEKPTAERKDSDSSSNYDSDSDYSISDEGGDEQAASALEVRKPSSESDGDSDLFGKGSDDDDFSDEESLPKEKPRAESKTKDRTSSKLKKKQERPKEEDLFGGDDGDDLFANSGGLFGAGANLFDKKKTGGLFDDAEISGEESGKNSDQDEEESKSQDLSSEEQGEASDKEPEKAKERSSKPHGGVSLFSGAITKELLSKTRRESDAMKSDTASQASEQSSKKASDLFMDDDEDEDDLFSSKPKASSISKSQPKMKSILSESDDEKPPPVDKKEPKGVKAKSAMDLFGSDSDDDDDLFAGGRSKKQSVTKPTPKQAPKIENDKTTVATKKKETAASKIFDSGSSSGEDSMFSKKPPAMKAPSKPQSKGIFDSDSDDDFFVEVKKKPVSKPAAKPMRFLDDESDDGDLFSPTPSVKKQEDKPKVTETPQKQSTKTATDTLFGDDSEENEPSGGEKEEEQKPEPPKPPQKRKPVGAVSMFGGALGGAELSAAISKRRTTSDISTKSSSSNDFEQGSKEHAQLFNHKEEKKEEEKQEEKSTPKPEPKITLTQPITVPTRPWNVAPKPFKPFAPSKSIDDASDHSKPPSSVSKLRIGLAIDPSTLLPGAARKPKPVVQTEISFDKPPVVKTLESFNKTRARGQRNRRPPSRHFKGNFTVQDEKSGKPTFVEEPDNVYPAEEETKGNDPFDFSSKLTKEKDKEVKKSEEVLPEKNKDGGSDDFFSLPSKPAQNKSQNLIDSADLDDELFSGSLFAKSDKKTSKAAAPKLFDDDDIFGGDDFLSDFSTNKKKDETAKTALVLDDIDDDIFGDLSLGGILSKKEEKEAGNERFFETAKTKKPVNDLKMYADEDIFGNAGGNDMDLGEKSEMNLDDDSDIFGDVKPIVKPKSNSKSADIFDDSDIFGDDPDLSLPSVKKNTQGKKADVFDDGDRAEEVKTTEKPKTVTKQAPAMEDDIFGDDIFADTVPTNAPKKKAKKVEKKAKASKAAGSSIFDDEDDMSDIFSSNSAKKKTKKSVPSKKAARKKEESKATPTVIDDPLSMG